MIFRYDELRAFLRDANERFTVTPLGDWDGGPALILRHDVDLDVLPAYRLAELERECGVRSTFFILATSPLYNPLAAHNRRLLRAMADWGFEIGLHFDPAAHEGLPREELPARVDEEAAVLAAATGRPVRSIALHNPSVKNEYPIFEAYRNAYDPAIFAPDRYLTDSRRRFAVDPRQFVERAREGVVQLVLHPMHFSEDGQGYDRIMSRFVLEVIDRVEETFDGNETYAETVRPNLRKVLQERMEGAGRAG
jgi:hypothetical protein